MDIDPRGLWNYFNRNFNRNLAYFTSDADLDEGRSACNRLPITMNQTIWRPMFQYIKKTTVHRSKVLSRLDQRNWGNSQSRWQTL